MRRRVSDEDRIEQYFGTCTKEQALKMYERVQVLMRARMFVQPERRRRSKQEKEEPCQTTLGV